MEHFETTDWIDFARGMASKDKVASMNRHLQDGCVECLKEQVLWARITTFAKSERSNEPPQDLVSRMIELVRPADKKARMKEMAQLVFDSFMAPAMAGVRASAAVGARQLLYRAGEVMIDVRLESDSEADRFALTGQVFSNSEAKSRMNRVPISLLSGQNELLRTATNQFGEFHLEHEAAKDLQVSLEISAEKDVFIPLDESIWRIAQNAR